MKYLSILVLFISTLSFAGKNETIAKITASLAKLREHQKNLTLNLESCRNRLKPAPGVVIPNGEFRQLLAASQQLPNRLAQINQEIEKLTQLLKMAQKGELSQKSPRDIVLFNMQKRYANMGNPNETTNIEEAKKIIEANRRKVFQKLQAPRKSKSPRRLSPSLGSATITPYIYGNQPADAIVIDDNSSEEGSTENRKRLRDDSSEGSSRPLKRARFQDKKVITEESSPSNLYIQEEVLSEELDRNDSDSDNPIFEEYSLSSEGTTPTRESDSANNTNQR